MPSLPSSLGQVGKILWKEITAELAQRRTLITADKRILEATCLAYQEMRDAADVIQKQGATYESQTANGRILRPRPECQQRSDAFRRYVKCLDALGLTPASRMRLQILHTPAKTDDEIALEEFFGAK